MPHAYPVTRRTAEIAELLASRAEELLAYSYGATTTKPVAPNRDHVRQLLWPHALVVAGTYRFTMIDIDGEIDFAATEIRELAELVVERAEASLPTDVVVMSIRDVPVRRVGVPGRTAAEVVTCPFAGGSGRVQVARQCLAHRLHR
jgi:hypothetical protein